MGKEYYWWSSVKKVLILAEGDSEEKFIKEILSPHFKDKHIYLIPKNLRGVSTYKKMKQEIHTLLKDSSATIVTTMIDLYRIPSDFPNKAQATTLAYEEKIKNLEESFFKDIEKSNFLPYLQLHEFESLLFSDVSQFEKIPTVGQSKVKQLHKILNSLKPEEINELPNTAPAKRITNIVGDIYRKPLHGIIIAKAIGLVKMREECPHFNQWITSIESI